MHEKHTGQLFLFPKRGNRNGKRTEKDKDAPQGKT